MVVLKSWQHDLRLLFCFHWETPSGRSHIRRRLECQHVRGGTSLTQLSPVFVFFPATMVHNTPTLDPLLAGLVSAFIITAVIITLLLFLKLRRRDNRPEFRRLQDLPMVSTSSTSRQRCDSPSLCGYCYQPRAPFHRPHAHGGLFSADVTLGMGGSNVALLCCRVQII